MVASFVCVVFALLPVFGAAQMCTGYASTRVEVVATDAVPNTQGMTTYRLFASLPAIAGNVYAIAGTESQPLHVPAAFQEQVVQTHIGGGNPLFFAVIALRIFRQVLLSGTPSLNQS